MKNFNESVRECNHNPEAAFFVPPKSISTLRKQQLLLLYFSKFLKNLRIVRENNAVCKDTNSYALAYGAASG